MGVSQPARIEIVFRISPEGEILWAAKGAGAPRWQKAGARPGEVLDRLAGARRTAAAATVTDAKAARRR